MQEMNIATITKNLENLFSQIEINYFLCHSEKVDNNNWDWSDCEKYFSESSYNKLEVTHIFFANNEKNDPIIDIGNWLLERDKFIDELCEFSKFAENKYELNEFFKYAFDFFNKKEESFSHENWLSEKYSANKIDSVRLFIKNEYVPKNVRYLDLTSRCSFYLNQTFLEKRNLVFDILVRFMRIYSEFLFLPYIKGLPKIEYKGPKINIYELLLVLEDDQKMDSGELEKLKAILLGIFSFDLKEFAKMRSEIANRKKGKYQYLLEVLRKTKGMEKYIYDLE